MNLRIQSKSGVPIYEQIVVQMRELILKGILKEGEMLPSIRSLASDLKISVITTKRAYEELEKEGMVYSVPGKGFYVDNPDRDFLEEKRVRGVEEELAQAVKSVKRREFQKKRLRKWWKFSGKGDICYRQKIFPMGCVPQWENPQVLGLQM